MAKINIGRPDRSKTIDVDESLTITQAFNHNDFHKAENEVIQDLDGNEYDGTEKVKDGKCYLLVQRVKSGC